MDVKILKAFQDKYTQRIYKPGEIVTLTKKRVTEINKGLGTDFIEVVPAPDPVEE